jgi:hypothetical protein
MMDVYTVPLGPTRNTHTHTHAGGLVFVFLPSPCQLFGSIIPVKNDDKEMSSSVVELIRFFMAIQHFSDSNWWNFNNQKWIRHNFRLWLIICGNDDVSHLKNCGERNLKTSERNGGRQKTDFGGLAGSTCYVSPFSFASNSPPAQLFSSLLLLHILAANCVEHPQRGVCIGGAAARQYTLHNTHTHFPITKTTRTHLNLRSGMRK